MAFFVGDSENDMETAKRAGINSLLVTYTNSQKA